MSPSRVSDGLVAGAVAGLVSGIPSTLHSMATGRGLLDATAAAGRLVASARAPRSVRVVAGGLVHGALSLGWGVVLAHVLPRGREPAAGAVAGAAIAALALGTVGRRVEEIRALRLLPQVADHVAFGAVVGFVLSRRRARSGETPALPG